MMEKGNNVYDIKPSQGPVSAVRIFFAVGLALFPVAPLVLVLIAWMQSDQDNMMKGFFALALLIVASVCAIFGIALLAVSGFMLLIRRVRTADDDVVGSVARDHGEALGASTLDLRAGWIPCLVYLSVFDAFGAAIHFLPAYREAHGVSLLEAMGGIGAAIALLLFSFFWTAGIVRLRRAGGEIPNSHYVWPAAAVLLFFLPIMLGD